jgi:hypothetical protein
MKIQQDKLYMIRHKPTGLFKASGHNGEFNKVGKIWKGSKIKAHLRQFESYYRKGMPLVQQIQTEWNKEPRHSYIRKIEGLSIEDCEIIELEINPKDSQPLADFIVEEMQKNDGN